LNRYLGTFSLPFFLKNEWYNFIEERPPVSAFSMTSATKGGKMLFGFSINHLNPLLALIFGVLILLNPKLLSTLMGIYLIMVGLIGLGVIRF